MYCIMHNRTIQKNASKFCDKLTWTEKLLLDKDIKKYHFVSQGKTEIPGLDDGEEFLVTDVSTIDVRLLEYYDGQAGPCGCQVD